MPVSFPITIDGNTITVEPNEYDITTRSGKGARITITEYDDTLITIANALNYLYQNDGGDGESTFAGQIGQSTFAGQIGQTVVITEVVSADYHVDITQLADSGSIGEVWVATRTVNAFVVKNSGSDKSSAFAWRISRATLA